MPMSPEVMKALSQTKPGGAAGVQKPPNAGPSASPMMTPQKPSGAIMKAKLQMTVAIKLLEQAMVGVGAIGKEGEACLKAIQTLAKVVGKQEGDAQDLQPMEQKTVAAGLSPPGAQGPPPPAAAPPGAGAGAPPAAMAA